MIAKKITIQSEEGLHARPATLFVRCAKKFNSDIYIENKGRKVSAKSMIGVLSLAVVKGSEINLSASGEDGAAAISALSELIESGFANV